MSPRRRDGELGPALNTDRLLDDLLARAGAGNLPLASDDEQRAWDHAWGRSHPDHLFADLEEMPLGIARRAAIAYIEVVLPRIPGVKRSRAEHLAAQAWERAHPEPPSPDHAEWWRQRAADLAAHREAFDLVEAQAQAACDDEREYVIRRFKLGDLVRSPVERLIAQREPPPPRPAEPDPEPGAPDEETP